jgi:hypothetical protein
MTIAAPLPADQYSPAPMPDDAPRALLIKAKGGMGNRMLSAVTGVVLAELCGRAPVIDWRDGMYVPAGTNLYPLLFDDPVGIDAARFDGAHDVAPTLWSGRLGDQPVDIIREKFPDSHRDPFLYRKLSIDLAGKDPPQQVGVFWSYLPKIARLRGRMARDPRFAGRRQIDVVRERIDRFFRPAGPVLETVDRMFAAHPQPVIGVHIRFTDRKAPLGRIESELRKLRARMPEAEIFLATDNADVQARILASFDRVFVIEKSLATDGTALHFKASDRPEPLQEARNALIDMWALARCDWLIHSRHSTFSVAAALIGAIPEDRQIDVDAHNPKVVVKRWFQALA